MHRTNIYLDNGQIVELDRRARATRTSRAAVLRALLDTALSSSDEALARDLDIFERAAGSVSGFEAVPRSDGDRAEHLARLWDAAR